MSGSAAAIGSAIAPLVAPSTPTSGHLIRLTGTAEGKYDAHINNPDTGEVFTFSGSGQVAPLGHVDITGHIHSPGNVADGHSTGFLVLSNAIGSVTLSLTGPVQSGVTPVPDTFTFKITDASGQFKGDTGTGYMILELEPAAAPSPTGEHGSFTMIFLTVPPPRSGRP
jgi:hypothetical protein